jgi:hypothetical protein
MTFSAVCLYLLLQQPAASMPAATSISVTTGGIKAEVQTAGGAPVVGAILRLKHRDGRVWTALTDGKGHFLAGGLPPGEYVIESSRAGFKGVACTLQIKAGAWLLGVPDSTISPGEKGTKAMRFHGPSTYEYAPSVIQPQKRPELGRIPMH